MKRFLLSKRLLKSNEGEGDIVSKSNSCDQEIWNHGKKIFETKTKQRVLCFLSEVPGIGKEIENFVKECGPGADAWRHTGVITFDGNGKVKKKPTLKRVKEHLEEKFRLKISYGMVVQLCVARHKRRKSAARYKGFAKVQQKRAHKGFNMKFNPDKHWSAAFYGAPNDLNLGRDDQAGFRLDTMVTHRQHDTLCVQGSEPFTTVFLIQKALQSYVLVLSKLEACMAKMHLNI